MITSHVFRPSPSDVIRSPGKAGGGRVPVGTCFWLGRCGLPLREHITAAAFRAQRGAR